MHCTTLDDLWTLSLTDRAALLRTNDAGQRRWLPLLAALVEPPAPRADFPAFLLETPRFAELRRRIGSATRRADLDTATADELQWFVDCYASWARSAHADG